MASQIFLQHRRAYGGEDIEVLIYDNQVSLGAPIYWKIVPEIAQGFILDNTFFLEGSGGAGWLNGLNGTSLDDYGDHGEKYSGNPLPAVITQTSPYLETPTPNEYTSFILRIPVESGVSPYRSFKINYYGTDATYTTIAASSQSVILIDESLIPSHNITALKSSIIEGDVLSYQVAHTNYASPPNSPTTFNDLFVLWEGANTYNGLTSWRPRGSTIIGGNEVLTFRDSGSWITPFPVPPIDTNIGNSVTSSRPIVKDPVEGKKQIRAKLIDGRRGWQPYSLNYQNSFYIEPVATSQVITIFDSAITIEVTSQEIYEGEGVSFLVSLDREISVDLNYTVYWRFESVSGGVTGSTFTISDMTGSLTLRDAGDYIDQILSKTTVVEEGYQEKSFKLKIYYDQSYTNLAGESPEIVIKDSSTRPTSESDPFYVSGGVSVGAPPQVVIDGAGNILGSSITAADNLLVNGDYTRLNSELFVEDNKITLNDSDSANDFTAIDGGIIVRGDTNKTLTWTSNNDKVGWTSNQNFNLTTGNEYRINDTKVIDSISLGSSVVTSSLTTVGTIGTGVWQGTIISPTYGGTGVNNGTKTITLGGNLSTSGAYASTFTMTGATTVTFPTTGRLISDTDTDIVTNAMLVNDGITVNGTEIKLGGSVNTPDNDTTYSISVSAATSGAKIDLVGAGTTYGAVTDSVSIIGGTNVTVTQANDVITIASTDTNTKYTVESGSATGGANITLAGTDNTTDSVKIAGSTNVTVTSTDSSTITISSIDTTYSAGTGVDISETNIVSIGQAVATTSTVTFSAINLGTATGASSGQVRASDDIIAFASSDLSLKENISLISDSLEKVKQLRGVSYDWKDSYIERKGGLDEIYMRKRDIGLIAQDVEKILPEIVAKRQDGYLAIKYDRVVALLVEAIKDLSEQVERLKKNAS